MFFLRFQAEACYDAISKGKYESQITERTNKNYKF